jgi:hypothetical protein
MLWDTSSPTIYCHGRCRSPSEFSCATTHSNLTRIFLFVGLVTIVTSPFVYWRLPNDITSAEFLNEHERAQAIERLRANQTGTGSRKFKWDHVTELFMEPKTWLFISMAMLLNIGAQVSSVFGPLIIAGFGFDKYKTSLLNMPFGVLQFLAILFGSYAALRFKFKSLVLVGFMVPVIVGIALLYVLPRTPGAQGPLMFGFYLFSFLFAGNPLIVSWIVGNTAGTTKVSLLPPLSFYVELPRSAPNVLTGSPHLLEIRGYVPLQRSLFFGQYHRPATLQIQRCAYVSSWA